MAEDVRREMVNQMRMACVELVQHILKVQATAVKEAWDALSPEEQAAHPEDHVLSPPWMGVLKVEEEVHVFEVVVLPPTTPEKMYKALDMTCRMVDGDAYFIAIEAKGRAGTPEDDDFEKYLSGQLTALHDPEAIEIVTCFLGGFGMSFFAFRELDDNKAVVGEVEFIQDGTSSSTPIVLKPWMELGGIDISSSQFVGEQEPS